MSDLQHLLDQIDRLDQEATPGPWRYEHTENPTFISGPDLQEITNAVWTDTDAIYIELARTALPQLAKALRAVQELHKPLNVGGIDGDHIICEVCVTINGYGGWDQRDHPCETYQAITDALGDDDA